MYRARHDHRRQRGQPPAGRGDAGASSASCPAWHQEILVDPQTSGGLLVALPAAEADAAVAALREAGVAAAVRIGAVKAYDGRSHLVFG